VVLLAWAYLLLLTAAMQRGDMSLMGGPLMPMPGMAAMMPAPWTWATFVLTFLMWWVMMVGMMIPSSLPAILLFSRIQHHYRKGDRPGLYVAAFVAGYLLAWGAFSALATAAQWGLGSAGLMSQMSMSVGSTLAATLLAAAGLYQLSPLKHACLRHCRSPAEFIAAHQRPGLSGALRTGAYHGIYCVGCCWLLMALLFVGGVMNLLWVAGLAVFVLVEKIVPAGHWFARLSGIAMLAGAALFALSAPG
jgi:predicted metal-binding membrane protein